MTNRIAAVVTSVVALVLATPDSVTAQDPPVRWQRTGAPVSTPVTVFHSTQSANLPTAETLGKGELLFEISHRFLPPISDGGGALWGFDGPVNNRLGLAYAVSDRVMVGIIRSSETDNLEFNAKSRLFETDGPVPLVVGAMGGVAFITQPAATSGIDFNERQFYGQVMVNALLGGRFALGVVPTLLHNARAEEIDTRTAFVLGIHGQAFLSQHVSLLAEWIVSEERPEFRYDSATFGVDLETGGHFFKILISSQPRMNATQYLAGSPFPVELDQMRVGFNITRILVF